MVPKVCSASNRYRSPCTGLVAPKLAVSNTKAVADVPRPSDGASGVTAVAPASAWPEDSE